MILIYGKGKVGIAVSALCESQALRYEVVDDSEEVDFSRYDVIIPSPGVPASHPVYQTGKVLAELDFASRFLPKNFQTIAITGTDGKSTTSAIMHSILQKEFLGKKSVYLSGNFDVPFSATVKEILEKKQKNGYIVLEVSSFMSYAIKDFSPDYSIFTNCKTDHLNWHRDIQEYLDAKMNLMHRTKKMCIMNAQVFQFAQENNLDITSPEHLRTFQIRKISKENTPKDWTDGEKIVISGRMRYLLSETHFSGTHNAMNILAVGIVGNEMKICSKRIKKYLTEITGLPHRLEKIGEKNGIIFVEDSKSTSAQSLEAALGSYGIEKKLLLIVGGSDKGDTFSYLGPLFQKRVKAMVCIGDTKNQFVEIAQNKEIPYHTTDVLEDGVTWLYSQGRSGDVLLLSPGCASFGLFRDYLDRAEKFREAIKKLP